MGKHTPVPAAHSPAGAVVGPGHKPAVLVGHSSPGHNLAAGLVRKLVGRTVAAAVVDPVRSFAGRRAVGLGAGLDRMAADRIGRTWLFGVDGDEE